MRVTFSEKDLAVVAVLIGLALAQTWPLLLHLGTELPGTGAGDSVTMVWNLWWMRHVGASPSAFFHTDHLLWPFGANLVLHTHTFLNGLVAATLLGRLNLIEAQNALVLASIFLNACGAYLLAYDVTRSRTGSVLAASIFGGAPYFAAHLEGHFNLIAAWPIPVWILFVRRVSRNARVTDAAFAGLALALVAYADYYYLVFSVAAALCFLITSRWCVRVEHERRESGKVPTIVLTVIASLLALFIVWILVSGGTVLQVGWFQASIRGTFNPRLALWATMMAMALVRWRFRLRLDQVDAPSVRIRFGPAIVFAAAFGAAIIPLLVPALRVATTADYVAPSLSFRSAPAGVDLVALVGGNPRHPLWGPHIRHLQDRLLINPIEGVGWLGVVPVILAWFGLRRWPDHTERRQWGWLLAVFLIWALGPFLMVLGRNTALVLPQVVLQLLPGVSNARMPGRAMVMVYLSLAMLGAMGFAQPVKHPRWPAWMFVVLVVIDYASAPIPLFLVDVPAVYETLRARPDRGALLELPMGIRDGFGSHGAMDPGSPLFQTIHEHPVVGGFVARVPARIVMQYQDDDVFGPLLRASDPTAQAATLPDPRALREGLRKRGVRYVILRRSAASPSMARQIDDAFGPFLIARDSDRELFEVRSD